MVLVLIREKVLGDKGYKIYPSRTMGSVQAIVKEGNYFYGSADPRRPNSGAASTLIYEKTISLVLSYLDLLPYQAELKQL